MDELLYKLLEQTPTIIALGVGIFALWKERGKLMKDSVEERKEHHVRLEKIIEQHKIELKELNGYVRERETEHLSTLKDIQALLEQMYGDSD